MIKNRRIKNNNLIPVILIISAFLPYLTPTSSIKGDNIIIFGLAIISIVTLFMRGKLELNRKLLSLILVWSLLVFYLIVMTAITGGSISMYSFIAEIKNFVQPLVILFIFSIFAYKKTVEEYKLIMMKVCKTLIILLGLNTLWIIIGWFIDLMSINQYFIRGVAIKAAGNSRFTGIFNQPMEAGIAYSIGIFAWLYQISKGHYKVNFKHGIYLALLIVGGVLSVSKIFIFGGLGIFTLNIIMRRTIFKKLKKIFYILPIISLGFVYYLSNNWTGISYLGRLFDIDYYRTHGILYTLTAGRFGEGAVQQSNLFSSVWNESPIIGLGLGSQSVYDSAFFHFFSSGGVIALLLYILLLFILVYSALIFAMNLKTRNEGVLFLNIYILIIISSFGAPILTVNRASVILWIFLCLIYVYCENVCRQLSKNDFI